MTKIFITLLTVLLLDQGSKFAAWRAFSPMKWQLSYPYGGRALFKDWGGIDAALVNHANKGAAWGLFADHQEFLMGVRVTLVAVMFFWLFFMPKKENYALPVALIASGALSNILDYFFYGYVVDIFYFRFWGFDYPIFNVADSAICIGALLLAWGFFKSKK